MEGHILQYREEILQKFNLNEKAVKQGAVIPLLQWISTHFGRAGLETSWELGNCIPEFAVSLLLEPIKLRTLK